MGILWQDIRFGARTLLRSPGLTAVAITALALGIGGNSAIFGVVNAVLLRPLPYFEPDRIVQVSATAPDQGLAQTNASYQWFTAFAEEGRSFERIGAYTADTVNLTGVNEPVQLNAMRMSSGVLDILRVKPTIGRNFLPAEERRGGPAVALISYGLWQRQFGSDTGVVGKSISLDSTSCVVIGVMPASFNFLGLKTDVWLPGISEPSFISRDEVDRGAGYLFLLARLKPAVTQQQMVTELSAVALRNTLPDHADARFKVLAVSLPEQVTGSVRTTLLILLGAVALVLLIACANVANLLLAKAIGRQREVAIRSALGASRSRLIRQFLTESILLAIAASGLGILLARWGVSLLASASTGSLPRSNEVNVDGRVLGFTVLIAVITGLLFGLAPALQASRLDLNGALKDNSRGATGGSRGNLVRSALVVAEVALSVVLLIGAGLLIKSFLRLQTINPGFSSANLLVANLSLPPARYATPLEQKAFYDRLLPELATLPGVTSVGAVEILPLSGNDQKTPIAVEGQPLPPLAERPLVSVNSVTPDYFKTMGTPLLQGRFLDDRDNGAGPLTVTINQSFKRRFFPNDDPVGKHLITARGAQREIVGVVGDVRHTGLSDSPAESIYFPFDRRPFAAMSVVLRTAGAPMALTAAVRSRVLALDRDQPVATFQTMEEMVALSIADRRFTLLLIAVFAAIALTLAIVGIYSVMAYTVSQRTAEIGLRMALGAQANDVLRLVVGQGMAVVVIGTIMGLAAAAGLTRVLSSLLVNVSATDPITFVTIPALLFVVALLACLAPALRAVKIDPIVALRFE